MTSTTSKNPTHDDNIVRDMDGYPLKMGEDYIIQGRLIGSGPVYWDKIGSTPCPNTVLQHNSSKGNVGKGMPVKFFVANATIGDDVMVGFDINIMFSVEPSNQYANKTVWKVDENKYVVTGGILGSKSNIFKIQKYGSDIQNAYKLTYLCEDVSTFMDNGNIRLAISPTGATPFVFAKAKNT